MIMGYVFDLFPILLDYAKWILLILVPLAIVIQVFLALVRKLSGDGYLAKESSKYLLPIARYSVIIVLYMFLAILILLMAKVILQTLGIDL